MSDGRDRDYPQPTEARDYIAETALASSAINYIALTVTIVSLLPVLWSVAYPAQIAEASQSLGQGLARYTLFTLAAASIGFVWLTAGRVVFFYNPKFEERGWLPKKHDAGDVFMVVVAILTLLLVVAALAIFGSYVFYFDRKMGVAFLVGSPFYMMAAILFGLSDRGDKLCSGRDAAAYFSRILAGAFIVAAIVITIVFRILP